MVLSDRLFNAVDRCDVDAVRTALDAGADVTARDAQGRNVLHRAALSVEWSNELVAMLAERGADLMAQDARGLTPLHYLCLSDLDDEDDEAA